jgi:PEP-CTERM motif
MPGRPRRYAITTAICAALSLTPQLAVSATITLSPVYLATYGDAVTGPNCNGTSGGGGKCTGSGWYITPGADVYGVDLYERPTTQGLDKYFGYLDLVSGRYGYDSTYMYFQLTMFSPDLYTNDGKADSGDFGSGTLYGVQIGTTSTDPGTLLLRAEQTKSTVDSSVDSTFPQFDSEKAQVWYDTNNKVGGTGGVAVPNEGGDNGYETQLNGLLLYSRSFYNGDGTVSVELAFNYLLYAQLCPTCSAVNPALIPSLVFETDRGLKDNQNYLWNDEYNPSQAGTPYGPTLYLGDIYELDNIRAGYTGSVPEPGSLLLFAASGLAFADRLRRRRRR